MKRTIDIPDALARRLEQYLQEHPEETLDCIVTEAIEEKLAEKNLTPLLELAGIVKEAPQNAGDRAEDSPDIIFGC